MRQRPRVPARPAAVGAAVAVVLALVVGAVVLARSDGRSSRDAASIGTRVGTALTEQPSSSAASVVSTTAALTTTTAAPTTATTSAPATRPAAPTSTLAPRLDQEILSNTGDHRTVQAALSQARSRWAAGKPGRGYTWRYTTVCFCPPPNQLDVDVDGAGRVTAVRPVTSTTLAGSTFGGLTVEAAFDELQKAIDSKADSIKVRFDVGLGYPASYFVDQLRIGADDEHGLTVDSFTQRP